MKKYYVGYAINNKVLNEEFLIGGDLGTNEQRTSTEFRRIRDNRFKNEETNYFLEKLKNLRMLNYKNDELLIEDERLLKLIDKLNLIPYYKYKKEYEKIYSPLRIIYSIVEDVHGNKYAKELSTGVLFPYFSSSTYITKYYLTKYSPYAGHYEDRGYAITAIPSTNNPFINLASIVVLEDSVASVDDVEKYNQKRDAIIRYSKSNAFADQIFLKKELEVTQTKEMVLLQDIEYVLSQIKQIDPEGEIRLRKEFDDITINYNSEDSNVLISINNLEEFKNKVCFNLYFNKKNGIDSYLFSVHDDICHKINGKDIKTISIEELDYIYELLLKYGVNFKLYDQNRLLKLLTLTYIAKIKEEDLEMIQIEKTHFIDLLKYASSEFITSMDDVYVLLDKIKNKNDYHALKLGK